VGHPGFIADPMVGSAFNGLPRARASSQEVAQSHYIIHLCE